MHTRFPHSTVFDHTLRRAGLALRGSRRAISLGQGLLVLAYILLLLALMLSPNYPSGIPTETLLFLFWGLWWPLLILSVPLLGRIWCGLLCPEGTLTEWVSHRGRGGAIPPWIRWGGWPFFLFLATTLYGQLGSVYTHPRQTLLLLGGSTVAAITIGLLYGRGKRVWCRYLCPITGVLGLLARIAPIHFRSDPDAWVKAPRGRRASGSNPVNCAPLLDMRRMQSASDCNMCGRCAGERDTVQLALRSPHAEILSVAARDDPSAALWSARLLVFGMLGMATATFVWPQSPWSAALIHDGKLLAAGLAAATLLIGGWLWLWLRLGARASGLAWFRLAMVLIPYAGASLLVGLSQLTTDQLMQAGIASPWADGLRGGLLALGALWSLWLAQRLTNRLAPTACIGAALALPLAIGWWLQLAQLST